jgi:hypothetical protein
MEAGYVPLPFTFVVDPYNLNQRSLIDTAATQTGA